MAGFHELPDEAALVLRHGLLDFQGFQDVLIPVLNDFGNCLRQRYPESRIWAIFEPRSNTTRRNIFQNELALSLATADFPVVAAVDHPDKVALEERLDLTKLSNDLSALGKDALIGGHAQEIVSAVCKKAQPGDVILVMSNGGFEGIHAKLLEALNA